MDWNKFSQLISKNILRKVPTMNKTDAYLMIFVVLWAYLWHIFQNGWQNPSVVLVQMYMFFVINKWNIV